jgi:hypothetical protein
MSNKKNGAEGSKLTPWTNIGNEINGVKLAQRMVFTIAGTSSPPMSGKKLIKV